MRLGGWASQKWQRLEEVHEHHSTPSPVMDVMKWPGVRLIECQQGIKQRTVSRRQSLEYEGSRRRDGACLFQALGVVRSEKRSLARIATQPFDLPRIATVSLPSLHPSSREPSLLLTVAFIPASLYLLSSIHRSTTTVDHL